MGDTVLVKNDTIGKLIPTFDPTPGTVVEIKGTQVTLLHEGKRITRNKSCLKRLRIQPAITSAQAPAICPNTPYEAVPVVPLNAAPPNVDVALPTANDLPQNMNTNPPNRNYIEPIRRNPERNRRPPEHHKLYQRH